MITKYQTIPNRVIKEILTVDRLSEVDYTLLDYWLLLGLLKESKSRLFYKVLAKVGGK